jgi:hypothetical protein
LDAVEIVLQVANEFPVKARKPKPFDPRLFVVSVPLAFVSTRT